MLINKFVAIILCIIFERFNSRNGNKYKNIDTRNWLRFVLNRKRGERSVSVVGKVEE